MKTMTEVKRKNSSTYTQTECNTAECIVSNICGAGIVVSLVAAYFKFLETLTK